ncbi:MAG: M20/M25/M40 family metallo-hydrolase [Halobacteriales archaeon]
MDPVAFLEEAVAIESHDSVDAMREYLLERVTGAFGHPSGCVVAEKGAGDHTVLLNTHLDTVAPHLPLERDDGVVRGRGACDAKGSLAAMVAAFESFDAASDLTLRLVVSPDEETTSRGIYDYLKTEAEGGSGELAEFAVVGEPTGLDVCTAAKGRYEATVVFHGESAHAASGDGRNAVSCASEAVRRFDAIEQSYDELLGESRLTVTRFEGGEASNQVPGRAAVTLDRRPLPDETQGEFVRLVEETLEDVGCGYDVVLPDSPSPESAAFRTDEDDADVRALVEAVRSTGHDADLRAFGAACEASYIAEHSPVVVFGPGVISEDDGTPVAHSEHEYVRTEDVRAAADALKRFLGQS